MKDLRGLRGKYLHCHYYNYIIMFSLVSNHLKLRVVVFLLPENEPFTRTEGADPLPQNLPCRSTVFLQKLRINNPNTASRDLMTLTLREGEMTGVFSWLQFALSPLDVTEPSHWTVELKFPINVHHSFHSLSSSDCRL